MEKCSFRFAAHFLFLLLVPFSTGCKKVSMGTQDSGDKTFFLEKTSLDLRDIADGESRIGQTVIKNLAAFPVAINRVSATCGCTKAGVTEDEIPPGGTSVLNVELAPQGRRGLFRSRVTVEWSGQGEYADRKGTAELVAQANAVFLLDAKPGYFDFGTVAADAESVEKMIAIKRGTQRISFEEIRASSDSEAVEARVVKHDTDSWAVYATLLPKKLPSGPARAAITLALFDEKNEEIAWREFSIRGEIKGLVSVKPKSLYFGVMSQGEKREGTVVLGLPTGRSSAIKRIRTEPESSCVSISESGSLSGQDGSIVLRFSVDTAGKKGDQSGRIFVEFEDVGLGSVFVPFIVHVK